MLSQTLTAISSRRHRAKLRAITPAKPRGRKPDFAKHARLVAAYEAAKAKGEHALNRLVIREGYASRDSLLKGYRWALKASAKANHPHPHNPAPTTGPTEDQE